LNLPEKSFTSWGDKAQIQQCLMNLIFNAIESMPEGGKLTIDGGLNERQDMVSISIADEGEGIPPEDLPRIFEPFYTTKDENKGVGLGLSMTYGIIRAHKGTLEVKSQPGEGTLFIIKLPAHSAVGMTVGSLSSNA
jgi:signal transduction histidine kinase